MHTTIRPLFLLLTSFFLLLSSFFLLPSPISAQAAEWEHQDNGVATIKSAETLFSNILSIAIQLIGFTTFLMIIIGGFKYLTSGGDPKATEAAQATITKGIAGLVLAVASWFILQFIADFTGANILNFSIGID
jgi:hypothetical protein